MPHATEREALGGKEAHPPLPKDLAALLGQFEGALRSLASERERAQRDEQTQAQTCRSLAFQVKSLQEENEELRRALAGSGIVPQVEPTPPRRPAAEGGKPGGRESGCVPEQLELPGSPPPSPPSKRQREEGHVSVDEARWGDDRGESPLDDAGGVTPTRAPPAKQRMPFWHCSHVNTSHNMQVQGVAISRDRTVASVSWDGTCRLFRESGGTYVQQWSTKKKGLYAVAFSDTAGSSAAYGLVAAACMDGNCYVLSEKDGLERMRLMGHTGEVNDVAFSGIGLAASVSDDTTCLLWSVESGSLVSRLDSVHTKEVYGVQFNPVHTNVLATVGFDKIAAVWDARTGRNESQIQGHTDDIIGVDFSACGGYMATSGDDGTCRVWDLRQGNEELLCLLHEDEVKRVSFCKSSPSGRSLLATASADGSARIWDWYSNEPLEPIQTLAGHVDTVFDVAWLPPASSGSTASLITASHDNTWRAWVAEEDA